MMVRITDLQTLHFNLQNCIPLMEMHLGAHVNFLFFMRKNGMQIVPILMNNINVYGVLLRQTTVLISFGATAQQETVGLFLIHFIFQMLPA